MIEITPKRQAMYVRKAIATLLSHKDIKRNSHSELKQACEEALKTLGKWFHEKISDSFTMWKFEDFPFTQNLREIKVGESRVSANQPFLQIERIWKWIFMTFYTFWSLKYTKLTKFRARKTAKTAFLEHVHSSKLISRKIWAKRGLLLQKINFN